MKTNLNVKDNKKEHLSKDEKKEIVLLFFSETWKVVVSLLVLSLFGITYLFWSLFFHLFQYVGADENTSMVCTVIISGFFILMLITVLTNKEFHKKRETRRIDEWNKRNSEYKENEKRRNSEIDMILRKVREDEKRNNQKIEEIKKIMSSAEQNFPWLAKLFADYEYMNDEQIALEMEKKKNPAVSSAQKLKQIAKEKRDINKVCKLYEYQLNFYENIFPWLEDFKELEPKAAWDIVNNTDEDSSDEYEKVRNWLSPEDWNKLPSEKKWQLALDRYTQRRKTNWEIGIDYERYVGFTFEKQGYKVLYQGALLGLEDMGRDLIAYKGGETLIIQCKRWSKEKTIHEKHIFQLFGSVVLMKTKQSLAERGTGLNLYRSKVASDLEPQNTIIGVFITTTELSDLAKECARFLNIRVFENYPLSSYPRIKCNNSSQNGKIYHLPFDQQYDKVQINPDNGDCYVATTTEAEKLGYRHAYRWRGEK